MEPPVTSNPITSTRDVTINIRAHRSQRDLIDQAAAVQGKTRSEFMLESAYQQAQTVLLEQCFFPLDDKDFEAFTALLDRPPTNHKGLRGLLTSKSPWE
jgi:uncharacterized protein (DUF1778 family)